MTKSISESQQAGAGGEKDVSDVLASINSAYLKEAASEDKELVQSWTETINIILTFGGLLSAVITAFLLVTHADLKPDPHDETNRLLLLILQRDNNTSNPTLDVQESFTPSAPTLRVLVAWHISLGCSLTSTFGALLSKLWVLHYQSSPRWADAEMDHSRLRESRFNSVEKWRMRAIIEFLPVILQVSVFLFYLGLAQLLHSTPSLFNITIFFATLMGALFVLTLLAGAFVPSCPYKSSLSSLTNRAVCGALFWTRGIIVTAGGLIVLSATLKGNLKEVIKRIKRYWSKRIARRKVDGFEYGLGERSIVDEEAYSPGVLCWWLQAPRMWKKFDDSGLAKVIDAVMESPVKSVMETERWKRNFEIWSLRVFRRLRLPSPTTHHQLQCDMVCYFMYHSSKANKSVKLAIDNSKYHRFTGTSTNVDICKAIRHGFATGGLIEKTPLPVASMRPTTLSVYLRYQLLDWGQVERETQWNRRLLLQELPTALKPEYFKESNVHIASLIDSISLAAIAIVPQDSHLEIHSAKSMANSEPTEQLLQAIHRLSRFSTETATLNGQGTALEGDAAQEESDTQREFIGVVVSGARRAFSKLLEKPLESKIYDSPSWKDGSFAESFSRLLSLGHTWWHAEPTAGDYKLPGATLVHELHDFILRLPRVRPDAQFLVGILRKSSDEGMRLSPDIVVQTFALYAHRSGSSGASDPHMQRASNASNALDYILGLRFYQMTSHRIPSFLPSHPPDFTLSRDPLPLPDFEPPSHLFRQLINNIKIASLRWFTLSIIVKSRDIFLPPSNSVSQSPLEEALELLFNSMFHSGNLLNPLSPKTSGEFKLWNDLADAIKARAMQLGHSIPDAPERRLEAPILLVPDDGPPANIPGSSGQ